jgi:glyoxylase-like metal-dependent hydrolase (beta-lactamase superfamily II)
MEILAEDGEIRIGRLSLMPYGTNAYLLICRRTGESAVVDAPGEPEKIVAGLKDTAPKYILLTHSHMDHIGALDELRKELRIPLAAHPADAAPLSASPDINLNDGDTLTLGRLTLDVIHTPGHTPGSLCFKTGHYLLSGDTLFPGGPGKTRTPADFQQIVRSITGKLFVLDGETKVFPGHGGATVLMAEKEAYADFSSRQHPPDLCCDVLWSSA